MTDQERPYPVSLTCKCRPDIAIQIRVALTPERQAIFRRTCFGPWLDIRMTGHDPMLLHMFLSRQVFPQNAGPQELYFDIGGHALCFGPQAFCQITGLRFGDVPRMPSVPRHGFISRVFPDSLGGERPEPVRVGHVITRYAHLGEYSDEDAVRICLLYMLEIGFLGRQKIQPVHDDTLRAIEDFALWDEYPWGSYIWGITHKQLDGAVPRRGVVGPNGKMTVTGFIDPLKIWILESFPRSTRYFQYHDLLPRAIRWERKVGLTQAMCRDLLDVSTRDRIPHQTLEPLEGEQTASWYVDSMVFLSGAPPPPQKRRRPTIPATRFVAPQQPSDDSSSSSSGQSDRPDVGDGGYDHSSDQPGASDPYADRWDRLDQLYTDYPPLKERVTGLEQLCEQFKSFLTPFGFQADTTHGFTDHGLGDPRPQQVDYYEATLTIKARISVAKDIFVKLRESDRRLALFRDTCFGPWLDIRSTNRDPLLIHLILQTQFFPEGALANEMWFRIGGHELRFGREEFCLITGLRFGPMDRLPEISGNPFRDRVFPDIPAHQHVKVSDLWSVFTSRAFSRIPDLDAVRICLLLLLEVGFSGRQPNLVVADFFLRLVEDLDSWNRYPWGSYLWALTHQQLKNALPRRQHHVGVKPDRIAKYTLTGFVFAFKIWIFETFPVARTFALRSDAIPRAIAWQWTQTITWDMCLTFLDVDDDGRQPQTVTSTDVERETNWWIDSQRFFDSVTDDFQQPTKRVRSYSPPQPPRPPPISSSAGVGASSPEAATTVPTPLEQRVAALEQAVHDLQAGQRALEVGQQDLEAGQRATQAGQRAILESMARLHEMVQRALEAKHRTEVRLKNTQPRNVNDDVAEGWP